MKYLKIALILLTFIGRGLAAEETVICRNLHITYDIAQLEEELKLVEGYYMPRHVGFDYWTAIPLRNATGTHKQEGLQLQYTLKQKTMLPCKDTPFLEYLPYTASILEDIATRFNVEIGLTRLSNVPPSKAIKSHRDGHVFDIAGTVYRLHVPIKTAQDVIFKIGNNTYNLEAGTLYFTNVSLTHSVENNGPFDRIHLVIDVHANDLLQTYIMQSPEVEPL
jgi:hypothetical protein